MSITKKRGGNMSREHTALVRRIWEALGDEPDYVHWINTRGVFRTLDGRRTVHVGLGDGAADIVGVLAPWARWLCFEAKTGESQQAPNQRLFQSIIETHGGLYFVVHSVDEARAALEQARRLAAA